MTLEDTLIFFVSFVLVGVASREIGHFLGRFNLAHITGYLFVGALAGPFILGLMSEESVEQLRFVDEVSLAVIAFIAGSELYYRELRSRIRPILLNTAGIVIVTLSMLGVALFLLTATIPFVQDMVDEGSIDASGRAAIALLGATILLALSPASTIAVIQEVRGQGPFTKTVLSITVVMDVVIIVLFAVSIAVAASLLAGEGLSIDFVVLLLIDLVLAVVAGYLVGRLLTAILKTSWHTAIKTGFVLLIGLVIFSGGHHLVQFSKDVLGLELHVESLLVCMLAGFYVTNFTNVRDQFDRILHDVSPWIYVAFFTLTGIGLKLDILLSSIGIALILFLVRATAIYIGSFAGGTVAGEPVHYRRLMGLGLVTQAGIALGLAREVSVQFPDTLGAEFATLIISVVVLNEIFGPLLLKFALRRAGESHEPEQAQSNQQRDALILGVEPQSLKLARQLKNNHWCVILADTDLSHVERMAAEDVDERHVMEISEKTMATLMTPSTDALVAMLDNDENNYRACAIAYEKYGCKRLIVRLNDMAHAERFTELGALVVDQASAMVNLLDQSVRAPQSAALMLHSDPEYDIVQITVTDHDSHGTLLRDLRLPNDVLILEIARNGHSIVPSGYTAVNNGDEVTLIGKPESLEAVTLKLGY
jgi:Trk K+ transport system NAD-binding subunit/Kef-type K+ transport system membrane component KefB